MLTIEIPKHLKQHAIQPTQHKNSIFQKLIYTYLVVFTILVSTVPNLGEGWYPHAK